MNTANFAIFRSMKTTSRRIVTTVQWISRLILAAALLLAGALKLQDSTALFETVAYITWLPVWLKVWIIDLLPWVEILLGVLLLTRSFERVVIPIVALIYLGFLGFSIYGTATGMEGDCGCFGELMDSSFGPAMIIRNAIFTGMAGLLFLKPSSGPIDQEPTSDTESEEDPSPQSVPQEG